MEASLQSSIVALPAEPVADILSRGVCPRCVFRFFGLRNAIYSDPTYTNYLVQSKGIGCCETSNTKGGQKADPEVDASKTRFESLCFAGASHPCICCLGILHSLGGTVEEQGGLPSIQAQIVEAVKKEGHQLNTFCLEVTIPGVVMVRERAVWQHLQEKYGASCCLQGKQLSEHVVSLKEALKWVLVKPLEESLQARYVIGSALKIALIYKHPETVKDVGFPGYSLPANTKRKRDVKEGSGACAGTPEPEESLAAIQRCLASMSCKTFGDLYPCPPSKSLHLCQLNVSSHRLPIYVGGRYLKFSRNLSQTRWLIDDERMGDGSVEETIANVIFPHFKADSYKFHAAGREDIDVRMLGNGRPFMLEISNARVLLSQEEIEKLQELINNSKEGWVFTRA